MAIHLSTKLKNFLAGGGSLKRALTSGELQIWSGAQPASADSPMTGTKLLVVTAASGARTAEVLSRGQVTLTGGAAGTVDTVTVEKVSGGATIDLLGGVPVAYNTSLTQTAADVAAAINALETEPDYLAIPSGANIIIQARPGTGTAPNGLVVACTSTTITNSTLNMGSGGAAVAGVAAVNGLQFGAAVDGYIAKAGTWSGVGLATGTAASYRFTGSIADANGDDSANKLQIRMDGTCGLTGSGADMEMDSLTITLSATHTVDTGGVTVPSA